MKILGVVGGISPESTIEYYRLLGSAPVIINSIDLKRLLELMAANELDAVTEYIAEAVQRLAAAGAEVGLIAANTPHVVFDQIQRRSTIPLISIVEATCDEAKSRGLRRLALFGTRYTMAGRFYPDVFSREGIAIVPPSADEQTFIHDIYLGELVKGIVLPETRARLLTIADQMKARVSIDGVILGGTDLSLILRDGDAAVPLLDTTRIHVRAALAALRASA
ncbi:MAG: amino acid racemase [Acidobacteriota bacterium]